MNPGASVSPRASTSPGSGVPGARPTSTMGSPAIVTSAARGGDPVPSNSVALRTPRRPAFIRRAAAGGRLLHGPVDDLHHVERLHALLEVLRLDAVGEHGHAERTRHGDYLGIGLQGLVGTQQVHALVGGLLDPPATAARAAAAAEAVR